MNLDLARIISRALEISWRHRWLWFLGVFGGGGVSLGGGFRVAPWGGGRRQTTGALPNTLAQAQAFLAQNYWIVLVVLGGVGLVVLLAFLVGCVAVPAAIWAAINLDDGRPVTLGQAFRVGMRRFGPFLRLNLVRLLIALALAAPAAASGMLLLFSLGLGLRPLAGSVLLLIVSVLFFIAASLVVALALVWSERLIVLGGWGALASMRRSWWLVRQALAETLLFAVLMGLLAGFLGIAVAVAAVITSLPGVIAVIAGLSSPGPLLIAGVAWIAIVGLATLLVGGGFVGSVVQVAYALACRDLCRRHGVPMIELLAQSGNQPPVAPRPVPAT